MRTISTTRFLLGAILLPVLCEPASAQSVAPPGQPMAAPTRAASPRAAACHNGASFDRFLTDLKQQAVAAGVSQRALGEAAPYLVYDQGIVNRDRGQRVFGQVFTEFAGRMAAPYRMQQGQAQIKTYASAFARAEKEYGVPPAVIAAFWGLESDFGANMGNLPTLRSLVSLAYDCRRSQMFANETIAALKIIDRGDLAPAEMVGSWAGELGQTHRDHCLALALVSLCRPGPLPSREQRRVSVEVAHLCGPPSGLHRVELGDPPEEQVADLHQGKGGSLA